MSLYRFSLRLAAKFFNAKTQSTISCRLQYRNSKMPISNITSIQGVPPQRQGGAVIHSVATTKEHRVHYGVQSATFVRTVFPGQAAGTYRINSTIPTWRGAQFTAQSETAQNFSISKPGPAGSSRRIAGVPPVPYPPYNASAYYSNPHTRIIPNFHFSAYG